MLLRGLGHQNDGDSLAVRSGKEKEGERVKEKEILSISVSLSLPMYLSSHLPSFCLVLSLSNIPLWRVSPSSSQVLLRIDVFVRLVLNSVPVLLPSLLLPPRPANSAIPSCRQSLRAAVKLGLFFIIPHVCRTCSEASFDYATLCVPTLELREIYFASSMF